MKRRKEQGFNLIELLIVVAIIAIITAIAIPNVLNSRKAANESSAIAALRAIGSAQVSYSVENNRYGSITELIAAGLLDERFKEDGKINGYKITTETAAKGTLPLISTGIAGYKAVPAIKDGAGRYAYSMYSDFVVRYAEDGNAGLPTGVTAGDPVGGKKP